MTIITKKIKNQEYAYERIWDSDKKQYQDKYLGNVKNIPEPIIVKCPYCEEEIKTIVACPCCKIPHCPNCLRDVSILIPKTDKTPKATDNEKATILTYPRPNRRK